MARIPQRSITKEYHQGVITLWERVRDGCAEDCAHPGLGLDKASRAPEAQLPTTPAHKRAHARGEHTLLLPAVCSQGSMQHTFHDVQRAHVRLGGVHGVLLRCGKGLLNGSDLHANMRMQPLASVHNSAHKHKPAGAPV